MKTFRNTSLGSSYCIYALLVTLVLAPLDAALSAPPTVAIELPTGPVTIFKGQSLALKGHASDSVTGNIDENGLLWASDLDGPLGNGSSVEVRLSAGTHNVGLTATNAKGEVALATVIVTVTKH